MNNRITTFLTLLLLSFGASAQVAGPVDVGPNEYAFQYVPFPNIGLFFNGTDQRYEFFDNSATPVAWIAPQTDQSYFRGRVGIGTETPATALHVVGRTRTGATTDYAFFGDDGDLQFVGNANYMVGNDRYAFRAAANENYVLYFNATDLRYEFRNSAAEPVMVLGADGNSFRVYDDASEPMLEHNGDNLTVSSLGVSSGITLEGSPTTTQVRLRLDNNNTDGRNWILQSTSAGTPVGAGVFSIRDEEASANRLVIDTLGNVGLGTVTPQAALDVPGTIKIGEAGDAVAGAIRYNSNDRFQGYNGSDWVVLDKGFQWVGNDLDTNIYRLGQVRVGTGVVFPDDQFVVQTNGTANPFRVRVGTSTKLRVMSTGGTSIGTNFTNPPTDGLYVHGDLNVGSTTGATGYKMAVEGKIICEELRVQDQADWPDYVFEEDYELPSIEEFEQSIKELGHLPGVPSAEVVEAEGFHVGEMQATILEKVEELSLYVIELNREIEELKAENEALRNK
jgi:hypothetical protein